MPEYTNALIQSTSPYLLQHAHNPVNWEEWSNASLNRAKDEDKPILVSIGYSSCHWCHVMEHESFEDEAIAKVMNELFICIKVDREERPDVDHTYMDAIQAMGLQGGWPLNVFLTPDQKPFYGGTYFPRNGWMNLLLSVHDAFKKQREKINESAEAFAKSLQASESEKYRLGEKSHVLSEEEAKQMLQQLAKTFDPIDGGLKRSPKFPMPSIWNYLAVAASKITDENAVSHLAFTLQKMADGGIYDQIGGGFARYSTDGEWHVPHFEKMLYDNGQLLSLYASGYKITSKETFRTVLLETIGWLEREMLDPSGGFYSALDADSEGEEGKFYVWSVQEVKELAGKDAAIINSYFDVKPNGNWEGTNILRITQPAPEVQQKFGLSLEELQEKITLFKKKALVERSRRERPGLDNKIIAGWNAHTLTGLLHAFQALGDESILNLAKKNASFIKNDLIHDKSLRRFPDKDMEGFLEDYAAVIQSFILYYETTFDRDYLEVAKRLLRHTLDHFFDDEDQLFFFSAKNSTKLIARKKELFDNVIPSSNALMAWNLVHLGTHYLDKELISLGEKMVGRVKELMIREPGDMSCWAALAMELYSKFAEIIVIGDDASVEAQKLNRAFIPSKILAVSATPSEEIPFQGKQPTNESCTIYVCFNDTCRKPVYNSKEALSQLDYIHA